MKKREKKKKKEAKITTQEKVQRTRINEKFTASLQWLSQHFFSPHKMN